MAWSHQPAKRRSIFASHCTVSAFSDVSSNASAFVAGASAFLSAATAGADSTKVTVFGDVGVVTLVVTLAAAVVTVGTVVTAGVITAGVVTAGVVTVGTVDTVGAVVTLGVVTAGVVTAGVVTVAAAAVFAFGFVSEEVVAGAVGGAAGFEVEAEDILLYRQ